MSKARSTPDALEEAIDSLGDLFYIVSDDGTFVEWNAKFATVTGYADDEIPNLKPTAIVPEAEREAVEEALDTIRGGPDSSGILTVLETKTGNRIPYEFRWVPLDGEKQTDKAVGGIGREIDDRNRQQNRQQPKSNDAQNPSVPIVEVWDGILLATVVGKLSTAQAEIFTEALLNRIAEREASVAIIDITGAEAVDTQTAQHLIDTIHAVKLMGGQTIITGLNPEISQTLVKLGVGFDVETQSSLQEGLKTALEIHGVSID